jgi:transposase-like protein
LVKVRRIVQLVIAIQERFIKMAKRRTFSPEFKSKLVLELLREERPLGEIANEHGISPNQLRNWKLNF